MTWFMSATTIEAYMNTGYMRSSSTPRFTDATTTPGRQISYGKKQNKKDLTEIIAAHNVPYAAQTTFLGNFRDLHEKAHKAIYTEGACFLNVMSPCPRGWRFQAQDMAEICKLAVETCAWPLYEVVEGEWHLTYMPKKKLPIEEYMSKQGRFKHCFKPGNEWMIEEAQKYVDRKMGEAARKVQVSPILIKQRQMREHLLLFFPSKSIANHPKIRYDK